MSTRQKGWRTQARRAAALGALYLGAGLAYNTMPRAALAPALMPPAAQWYGPHAMQAFNRGVLTGNTGRRESTVLKLIGVQSSNRKLLSKAKTVLSKNPLVRAANDSRGIRPGTHLVVRYSRWAWPLNPGAIRWGQLNNMQTSVSGTTPVRKKVGNVLKRALQTFSIMHHGIYVGDGIVMAYPEGLETIEEFTEGRQAYVVPHAAQLQPGVVVKRAIQSAIASHIGYNKYDMIDNNCEQFVSFIMTGKATSLQVRQQLFPIIVGVGGIYIAIAARRVKRDIAMLRRLFHIVHVNTNNALTSQKIPSRWAHIKKALRYV
jgi:hypothetical protein